MSLRLRHKLTLRVSETSAEKVRFFDNQDDENAETINDELQQEHDGTFKIAATATEALGFGDVAAPKFLQIWADATMHVILDGNPAIVCEARTNAAGKTVSWFGGTIAPTTSVQVTNPSATAILSGKFLLAGDLAP